MRELILFISLLFLISCNDSRKITYHEYFETASDYDITKWNLIDTIGHKTILKETIDKNGRVKQLEFLLNGKYVNCLCYLANKVTYDYKENLIVETLFWDIQPLYANDCEVRYKRIYHLDNEKYITKIESFAIYDTMNIKSADIILLKKSIPKYSVVNATSGPLSIDYYTYSYAKMNGLYPVSKNYKIVEQSFDGDQLEKQSIENGLAKYKKSSH